MEHKAFFVIYRSWARNHFAIVVPFIIILVVLVSLSLWELRFQDGGRVFLVGEDLMANAEKRATVCLLSYSTSHSDRDLQCFKTEVDVVVGDMQARRELDSPRRSFAVISDGLVRGRNRPQDVPTAILFYRLAPWLPEVAKAVQIWRESDQCLLRLNAIASQLQSVKDAPETATLDREILQVDSDFSRLERNFALHLNYGMHFLAMCLCLAQAIAAVVLTSLALVVYRRVMKVREPHRSARSFLLTMTCLQVCRIVRCSMICSMQRFWRLAIQAANLR